MKKIYKKKKTASGGKQSISFEPLIVIKVPERQGKDIFNEHKQIIKASFKSLTGC